MNKIDCKIVLEEYVLLHQAYENQEFKRLLWTTHTAPQLLPPQLLPLELLPLHVLQWLSG